MLKISSKSTTAKRLSSFKTVHIVFNDIFFAAAATLGHAVA